MNVTNCQSFFFLSVCMENLWLSSLGHLINMTARREMGWDDGEIQS